MALYTKIKGDISYTEMGSPTVLDGVASGFSTSNYLKLPTFAPGNKSWELKLKFLSNNAGTTQAIVRLNTGTGDYGGMLIGMNGNNRLWWNIGSSGTSWFQTNPTIDPVLTNNTWYEILVKYDGSKYTLSIINNGVATVAYTNNTATPIYQQGDTTIGARVTGTTNYFRGSVDLNNTYIKIENTVWFGTSFSKVKVRTGLVRYTVVGSPTITNGIASNFSGSNYLTLPRLNTQGLKKVEFGFCLVNVGGQYYRQYFGMTGFSLCISNGGGVGINYSGSSYYNWNTPPSTGEVLIKSIFDIENSQLIISWTSDGQTYKTSTHQLSSITHLDSIMNIGSGGISIIEAINLKRSYIKVDDKYYWRGFDYQSINAWKIQQDNFSKYYTIVDGKLMWASPDIYLQSSGTQYINTGKTINLNDTILMDIAILDPGAGYANAMLYGANSSGNQIKELDTYRGSGATDYTFYYSYNSTALGTGYNFYSQLDTKIKIKNILESDKFNLYVNDSLIKSITAVDNYTVDNLNLFKSSRSSGWKSFAKVYSFKVIDFISNQLKLHLVPVPKGLLIGNFVVPSNGMFDIVEQKFYPNQGTGEFEIGGIPPHYIIEGGRLIWCNPEIYLQSSGTQYIDTGLVRTGLTDSYQYITSLNYQDNQSRQINGSQGFCYFGCVNGYYQVTQSSEGHLNLQCPLNEFVDIDILFNCPNQSCTYTIGNTTGTISSCGYSTETKDIYLFNISNLSFYNKCKMKAVQLYKNNELMRYFIPVPKGMLIGDKIAPSNCMFDMVTQQFFINQGTGDFIIGGIPSDYMIEGDKMVWCNPDIYLESTGTQYINTGCKANQDTYINLEYTPQIVSGNRGVYCSRDTSEINSFTLFSIGSAYRYDYNTSQNSISGTISAGTRKVITTDKNKFYVDGTLKYTATYSDFQSSYPTLLFCSYVSTSSGSGATNFNLMKLYFAQIKNDTQLVRYLVPVPKNMLIKDKIAPSNCMFDLVTQKFFTNQGTGDFAIGGLSGDLVNTGDNVVWTHENVYLQSSGTEYVDTSVKPTNFTTIESKVMLTVINKCIYGSRTSKDASDIHDWIVNTATTNYPQFGSEDSKITYTWNLNQAYRIKNGQSGAYVNGTLVRSYDSYLFTSTHNMYLFGLNQNGALESRPLTGKIYYFFIDEKGKLIRSYYPVDIDTVIGDFTVPAPGMWDAVNKKFYPNAGTGTFTYGKDS